MKYLISINELLKSTYLRASQELGSKHKDRGQEMIDWAADSGEDVKQDRIYPHRFIFDDGHKNEYYFIVESKWEHVRKDTSRAMILRILIVLKSNWGEDKLINVYFDDINSEHYRVADDVLEIRYYGGEPFKNSDPSIGRRNALHLYRFIMQLWEDEIQEEFPEYKLSRFSVNKLYSSSK